MKNTFPTVSHASFRARRGDRLAGFRAMAAWLTIFTLAGTAGAATLTVTNLNDSGAGSLRDSIASASAGDKIQFQVTGTIALTSGQLTIGRNLTISGPGPSQLAINDNHASRVFEIAAGATVSLSGLTVENGFQYEIAIYGGGILNRGTLTATNCTITGNSLAGFGAAGGGIANLGQLTLDGSSVTGNSAMIGAGIVNFYKGTVKNSTVSGNSASTSGGGISNWGSQGGASDTSLTVTNSTLSGNSAGSGGGGIISIESQFAILNSTVAGNSASEGGGLYSESGYIVAANTLLANNIGGNCALTTPTSSKGYNFSDDNSCAPFTATGDVNNVQPGGGLDPKGLQSNGGPTQTIALLPASPAVDAVPAANWTDANGNPLTTDQRGTTRPQGKACDAGAYEVVQTTPFSSFNATLAIATGKIPGFALASRFTTANGSQALQPQAQSLVLQIANYTLTLPAGSLKPLWNGANAPFAYDGTINGAHLVIALISLGNNTWSFNAAGTPVTISATNPVPVTLTIGQNTGTTSVQAIIR